MTNKNTENDQTNINFEENMQMLEKLVKEMESGDLTLEQSLEAFEKGVKIVRKCQESLTQAEVRVNKLMQEMNLDTDN
ncbi:MAG: exodeoxyribonuclease VII small subunit [Gammaproteobacteria bacterium]|nr:exodeoxyribonuclease VII small subunit [Gammaproteobacteria bacterium]MDE0093374.1 exodeoxyribonuclease VII small subunit [Gammaproteobacteria bacterium]MDE0251393.1 exodeoxyribonuclease VII small subunit [Gammaproteobacteria bacterium]MDE0401924.1 exodeoxyribonuclease VII small subunit [Gammaproteobacteria bacterium]MDE0646430.1 exodeoxyribonuclease VII small subunit [Gammaproteobacteria bacterium]